MISRILRAMPAFKGKQRLARFLLKDFIHQNRDIVIQSNYNFDIKVPNIKETVGFELFINGIYEKGTIDFITNAIRANSVFLDIGANIGAITIPVCKRRNDISAICLEAAPWVFKYLEENIKTNSLNNVTLINKAISVTSKDIVLFYSPSDKFGKGSMAPVFTSEGVKVETITLADLISPHQIGDIGFIKIDIEGFEYFAFKGGEELLRRDDAPDILFEFADWAEDLAPNLKAGAAQSLLFACGYRIYLFDGDKIGPELKAPRNKNSAMFLATKKNV